MPTVNPLTRWIFFDDMRCTMGKQALVPPLMYYQWCRRTPFWRTPLACRALQASPTLGHVHM
ncbi:hypothetical protein FRC10_004810 [Ceratobasidium sp. 414]|nr:hypothetical protein FRC10_004810 [Ceratobasidium sp. 414]